MADLNNQTLAPSQEQQARMGLKQAQKSPPLPPPVPSGQESLAPATDKMEQAQASQMAALKGYRPGEKEYKQQLESKQKKMRERKIATLKELATTSVSKVGVKFTAAALKQSWLNIIDTFGLTLLYINFHFLGKYVAGSSLFGEFGSEWAPPMAEKAGGKVGKMATGAAKFAEIILLLMLDFLIVLIAFFAFVIIFTPVFIVLNLLT